MPTTTTTTTQPRTARTLPAPTATATKYQMNLPQMLASLDNRILGAKIALRAATDSPTYNRVLHRVRKLEGARAKVEQARVLFGEVLGLLEGC